MIRQELYLASPLINTSGTMGFTPPVRWPVEGIDIKELGAFVTNPISLGPRTPAAERGQIGFSGGVLLHSGLPNPGFSRVLRKFAERWAQSNLPIWVHLFGKPDEIYQMVRSLEGRENITAVELGIQPDARPEEALAMVGAAYGELQLIVQLPLDVIRENWVGELGKYGVSGISLASPRGMLVNSNGHLVSGRIFGPALLPLTLAAIKHTRGLDIPILAGPGIYSRQDAETVLAAGAFAVQLDSVLWRGWGKQLHF